MAEFPVIPGYKIKKKIGQGGMADVYLGVQENLSRIVAIKVLSLDMARSPRTGKRFIKEARTLSRLTHPNIVTIHDVGQAARLYFIVMEYLQDSLKERIGKKRKIPPEESFHIVLQVADALFHAHAKGYIHRDIKPDNIMFRQDGTPVVLDFGIAKSLNSGTKLTRTGMSVGTPQYMSPEQCNAETLDGRSDIYSLGVVLYEMLTGKPPYTGNDTMSVVMKHLKAPVPVLPAALREYQPAIDKMMAKEKKKRLRSKNQLNEIFKQFLNLKTMPRTKTADAGGGKKKNVKKPVKKKAVSKTPVTEVTRRVRTPRTPGTPHPARTIQAPPKSGGKAKLFLRVLAVLLPAVLIFLVVRGELLPELVTAVKAFFTAVGDFLF